MLKLIKYLTQFKKPVLIIIALLFIQAMCDLALPDYTSNIVDIGIQQAYNTNKMQSNYIIHQGAIMILIALLSVLASVIVGYLASKVAAGLGKSLRRNVFRKVTSFLKF